MATVQATNIWQDGGCARLKQRSPKIGDITRQPAVEHASDDRRAAPLQSRSLQSPSGSPRFARRKPLKESRRVSIEMSGSFVQLNQYKLMDAIGQGSYGVVKLAYNEEDDRHYAMKILSKKKLLRRAGVFGRAPPSRRDSANGSPPPHPLHRVYREIAVLKKLDHPNVVKLIEVLDDPMDDCLYLVFELLERGQVLDVPTDEPLEEERARGYFRDIILGLEYLHYQRIIHRDLKPANLLLSEAGRVQIADLGVCGELDGADDATTACGTPAFAAPEPSGGRASDVWSLGATLFALAYGRVPFDGADAAAVARRARHEPLRFPAAPATSDALRELIARMLAKEPSARITVPEIKRHRWVTRDGAEPLPSEEENCRRLVEVTDEDVARVVTSIPKLDTLILIKHMLKKHSFQNPFLLRRRLLANAGRSNSAPDSCCCGGPAASLEAVTEADHAS